jgi:hypothetical protein
MVKVKVKVKVKERATPEIQNRVSLGRKVTAASKA